MQSGWIKMRRNERELFPLSDPKYSRFEAWLDIVCHANWSPKEWQGILIDKGSFCTSQEKLAERWKWSKWAVKRFLDALKKAQLIRYSTATHPQLGRTIVEVLNYDRFQGLDTPDAIIAATEPQLSRSLSAHNPLDTKEEEIIIRNNISNKSITRVARTSTPKDQYGEFVFLTKLEHEKFVAQFGIDYLNAAIEKLNSWIGSNPIPKRKTNGKNAAATFRTWVFNALDEQRAKTTKSNGYQPYTAASTFEHNLKYLQETRNEPIDFNQLFNAFGDSEEILEIESSGRVGLVSSTKKLIG